MIVDKASLKRTCKETRQPMGIYKISSPDMDKVFIGYAINLPATITRHRFELKLGSHRNHELQVAWNRIGGDAFNFEILDVLQHRESAESGYREELKTLLEMWIHTLSSQGVLLVSL